MEEKKTNISTILLILAIIIIVVMGVIIFKLNNEKLAETQKASDFETQIASLNEEISTLQNKIDQINSTINGNSTTNSQTNNDISTFTNGIYTSDAAKYTIINFLKDTEFNIALDNSFTVYGKYEIDNNIINCTMDYYTFKDSNETKKNDFADDETWNLYFDITDDKTIKVKSIDIPSHESEIVIGLYNVFTEGCEYTIN